MRALQLLKSLGSNSKTKRVGFIKYFLFFLCLGNLWAQNERPNVLLVIIDDFRTELKAYGVDRVHAPNMDRLSRGGITFQNAYSQKAVCVPSRQSFLTGARPNTFGAGFGTHFREKMPDVVTLPQQFKKNGYWTESIGKVFHHRDDRSWDLPSWVPTPELTYPIYKTDANLKIQKERIERGDYFSKDDNWWANGGKWVPASIWEAPDVPDDQLTDGMIAQHATERLKILKDSTFFMAVGFFRPHIPFVAPKKYYDLYPLDNIKLPVHSALPKNAPLVAKSDGGEWRKYTGVVKEGMPSNRVKKEYIRGYLAAISYVDAQVGKVLDCLDELMLDKNTIVVLMSDHGYHLFDNASFGKLTNFEKGTQVPLIIKNPKSNYKNIKTNALVELLDIYPTLCDVAQIPIPDHVAGKSFANVFSDPSDKGKEAAYSQFYRNGFQGNSVRTHRYRFTRWHGKTEIFEELYDYKIDANETENKFNESSYKDIIPSLERLLSKNFDNG